MVRHCVHLNDLDSFGQRLFWPQHMQKYVKDDSSSPNLFPLPFFEGLPPTSPSSTGSTASSSVSVRLVCLPHPKELARFTKIRGSG